MKIFIICCLLFIHVNMCIFIHGFWVSIRVSDIHGFGFGDGFPPESVSGSGFDFGFRFWVHEDSTQSEPDPLPSLLWLLGSVISRQTSCMDNRVICRHVCVEILIIAVWTLEVGNFNCEL